ncbi:DNA primase [Micromonospora cathayae]|uniref:DNA primase n=1 Tax=Micromonospora cathayae TaxID=3028804 RepID=A0ABY7ZXQ7_9ACTN|nr:DNA primase [Micromonospora sp. HUAS 3]WDZ86783.1 DNA primase [Micromonospora sp. HUAS 3]
MARQSSPRPDADEPQLDESTTPAEPEKVADTADTAAADPDRSLWEELRIDPVEIALPAGTGYTLRAYRPARELTPTDVSERDADDPFLARGRAVDEDEDDDETVVILDEELAEEFAEAEAEDEKSAAKDAKDAKAGKSDDEDEDDDGDEEVPVFLTHRGRLLLFKTPESLVSFVRSGAPNDMSQLDGWNDLAERVEPADIAPLDEDTYELDLVVENLRGGHDTWDATLLIEAGEVARDLAYALRLPAVLDMLSAGSSLDDLDEALRATVDGGIGGFMGRRRLKKIGAQTASLGWRTIVGKISAAVDWRD